MDDLPKKILITMGIVIIAIPALFGIYKLTTQSQKPPTPINLEVTEKDWITGNKQAPNELVEYSDLQCPACRMAHPLVKEVIKNKRIKFVYRHFPLSMHKNSVNAAMAAEAAGVQNKFWEMQDLLFINQEKWAESKNPESIFIGYAKQLKLDTEKFQLDLKNKDLKSKIDAQMQSGNIAGVNATPTFYLNGVKIDIQALQNIETLLK
ncbi:MAG TPA: thioredoxin domain-containing protein [Candidatus Nitrosocosmicus sp.]|nr:thioredoxin domain-containing protein [Candidatus Nitrosocosmicus sp.]